MLSSPVRSWLSAIAAGWLLSVACSRTDAALDEPPDGGAAAAAGSKGEGGNGGSDGGDRGGHGAVVTAAQSLAACRAYCETLRGASCAALPYPSVEECVSSQCGSIESDYPACQPADLAYYECGRKRSDVCLDLPEACPTELAAQQDCISVPQCPIDQPVGGCTDPKVGSCYQSSVPYECDHTMGKWRCPTGTAPAPVHDCSATTSPDGGGGALDRTTVTAACNAYCERLGTVSCDMPPYASVQICKSVECSQIDSTPEICLPSSQAYYDCARTRADVCSGAADGCPAQLMTFEACLNGRGTLECSGPPPVGVCALGPCYHDPLPYECDTLRGVWVCPAGTYAEPASNCGGPGGTGGGTGGAHP
jgi:hypothetical protein